MIKKAGTDLLSIGSIYGEMLNNVNVVAENTDTSTKKLDIGKAELQKGGPKEADGFEEDLVDGESEDEENAYAADNTMSCDEDEETFEEHINTSSMKKSSFDKLFEQFIGNQGGGVEDDLNDLGAFDSEIGGDEGGDDFGDEEGGEEELTLTLPRSVAEQLRELLNAVLDGGDEFGDEGEGDFGGDDGLGDDLESDAFGDEDEETLGTPLKGAKKPDIGKKNKVGSIKTSGGSPTTKVTDKVGDDGSFGTPLKGAKQPDMGKNNKVGTLKTGKDFFNQ